MRIFKWVLASVAFVALGSCGGSGSCGNFATCSSGGGGGGTQNTGVALISVTTSVPTISTDGTAVATITATAVNSQNDAVADVPLTVTASAGAITGTPVTTDASGVATVPLSAQGVAAGTAITVTVASGAARGTVVVNVIAAQETVTVTTSSPQMPSAGTSPVTITALVRGASNQLLSGVPVSFGATSGGLQTSSGTSSVNTGANGAATATLTTAGDPSNRSITVTATVGNGTSGTVTVNVVGTTLSVAGPASVIQGTVNTYTVALADSSGNGIPATVVALTSAVGNPLSSPPVTTDSTGHASFTLTATSAMNDTLTAKALGLSTPQAVTVSSQAFAFTAPLANADIDLGAAQTVSVTWTNGGAPQAGQTINFSTTRGEFNGTAAVTASAVTNAQGVATVTIASTTAGPAQITATATGVSSQVGVEFVATQPTLLNLQASPDTVPTLGQSTITAVLRDAQGNLVANQTVDFQLQDTTGGSLSVGSAIMDLQGIAQSTYTAGSIVSATNGVTITGTVPGTSVPAVTATLTVGGRTVFLVFGTGVTIGENSTATQFILPYVVQATDSDGNPQQGVNITLAVVSNPTASGGPAYFKGFWSQTNTSAPWVQTINASCANEDVNGNGVLDPGEDTNHNGRLDPGNVANVVPSTVTTDSTGSATFNIYYPEDHAAWVVVQLTATTLVQGTQNSTTATFTLPMKASYIAPSSTDVPGAISPYGTANSCANPN